jgi:predicted PurR-regulated permease PerM
VVLAVVEIYRQAEYLVVRVFSVLLLFVFASVVALLLTPVVDYMQRWAPLRNRRGVSVLLLYAVMLLALAGALAVVTPIIITQAKQLPELAHRAQEAMATVQGWLGDRGLNVHLGLPSGDGGVVLGSAVSVITGTIATLVNIVLTIVISIYLLVEGRELIAALRKLFPQRESAFDFTLVATGATVAAYARGQLAMSTAMGVYTAVAMSLLGVPYALLLGVAAFLLEFLPLIGAPVAMILGVAVALLHGPQLALLAGLAGAGGHAIEAYILGPRVFAHATRLHPLAAMAALLVGAELGGVLGALFAVPLAAISNVFLGAYYRSRRGDAAFTTGDDGEMNRDNLPRLGEEISEVADQIEDEDPVPHADDSQPDKVAGKKAQTA